MDDATKETPYLGRGVRRLSTESSTLVSSSKYLNSPRLREWVSTSVLRRNGPDFPIPADNIELVAALAKIRDEPAVDALFEAERKINPRLDRWLGERFMSTFVAEDLKDCPPGSVGWRLYRFIVEAGAELDIVPRAQPKGHFDFYTRRHLQTHDLEHIVTGGLFDALGEVVPYWMSLSNLFQHLSPELAGELNVKYMFNALRVLSRSILHYPQTWPKMLECIVHGIQVGQASEPIFMFRYEDVLHLSVEEAREALGVRMARDVDTTEAAEIFTETVSRMGERIGL
jgi:ubiquinone biosynthesis protein Coq4